MDREISRENLDIDYHFLRENGVCSKTALKITGMVYIQEEGK